MDRDKTLKVSCTNGDRGIRVIYDFLNGHTMSVEMDKGEALKIVRGCVEAFGQEAILNVVAPLKTIRAGTLSPLHPDFEHKWLHRLGACNCRECKKERAQATIQAPKTIDYDPYAPVGYHTDPPPEQVCPLHLPDGYAKVGTPKPTGNPATPKNFFDYPADAQTTPLPEKMTMQDAARMLDALEGFEPTTEEPSAPLPNRGFSYKKMFDAVSGLPPTQEEPKEETWRDRAPLL